MTIQEKVIKKFEKAGYKGIDASLEISLFEYGLIVSSNTDENGEYHIIYGLDMDDEGGYIAFEQCCYSEKSLLEDTIYESWFKQDGFLNYLGMTLKEWLELPVVHKISDMLSYYGYQNIFGETYYKHDLKSLLEIKL